MSADAPIEVWQAPVDVHARDSRSLLRTLAPEERRRAASGTSRALRWAAGRSALRVILAGYLGSDPATIAFEHGPHGKPSVTGGPEFSFSASGGMALVAVSPAGPVGVDVERIRPRRAAGRIARSRFAAAERTALAARGSRAGQAAFHRCWAAKEAYAKGLGRGLALGLDRYSVAGLVGPEATARCAVEHPGRSGEPWEVERLPAAAGYAAAIAAAGPAWRAELRPYPGPEGRDG